MIVRNATIEDIPEIVEFNRLLALETEDLKLDPAVLREGVAALIADPGKGRYFIADASGSPLGQAMVTFEWSDWRNGAFWWIQSVYVRPASRRQGVFTLLFEQITREARADGNVCGIRLYVERGNDPAIRTYNRLGMKDSGYGVMETTMSHTHSH